jgi:hypothetical protein
MLIVLIGMKTLWAYKKSYKVSIKHNPFELVYGLQPLFPL